MDVYSAIQRRRSIRRFKQQKIRESLLNKVVDAARLAPSASNLQPLEYILITDEEMRKNIFVALKWAKYVNDGDTPPEDMRPTAYIAVLVNRSVAPKGAAYDVGAAVQNILLAAFDGGVGTCWVRSIDKKKVNALLKIPDTYDLDSIVALGYPAESPMTERMKETHEYWRDDRGLMHVPKRKIDQIIHKGEFENKKQ